VLNHATTLRLQQEAALPSPRVKSNRDECIIVKDLHITNLTACGKNVALHQKKRPRPLRISSFRHSKFQGDSNAAVALETLCTPGHWQEWRFSMLRTAQELLRTST